jgi:hypothetical protein
MTILPRPQLEVAVKTMNILSLLPIFNIWLPIVNICIQGSNLHAHLDFRWVFWSLLDLVRCLEVFFSLPPQPASTRLAPSSQGCWVCPILSWHHQSWDPEPDLQGRGEIRSSHGSTWCVWEKGGRITLMIWQFKILCYGVILSNNIQYIRDYHHPNYHLTWNNGDMVGYTTTMAIRYVWALGIDRFTI